MFNIYNLILAGAIGAFVLLDTLVPARRFPQLTWWRLRGVAAMVLYFALASYSPWLWSDWLGQYRLVDATGLPLWLAVVAGYAAMQFVGYWWHRALHASPLLWRVFHQMHHASERLDIYSALMFHPLDTIGFTFVGSFALTVLFGVAPLAAALVGVLAGLVTLFSHANLRTPRWLGWLIARPEVHALHHERGRHAGNYGELMVWDMLFGTYRNPRHWAGEAGFYDGASARILDMLLWRDVSRPRRSRGDGSSTAAPASLVPEASAEARAPVRQG